VQTTIPKYDLITTHTARRSFATNLFLSGFPAISIMKITGHKTEKSFMKYIKISQEENANLLQLHWNKGVKLKVV
jgi:integrase